MKLLVMMAGLVIVLAAAAGGLTWWLLPGPGGQDSAEAVATLQRACAATDEVEDYDVHWVMEIRLDGKKDILIDRRMSFSGKDYHSIAYVDAVDDVDDGKGERLFFDGDLYALTDDGQWEKKWENFTTPFGYPIMPGVELSCHRRPLHLRGRSQGRQHGHLVLYGGYHR